VYQNGYIKSFVFPCSFWDQNNKSNFTRFELDIMQVENCIIYIISAAAIEYFKPIDEAIGMYVI
jgi:hypothetical protein